MRQVYKPQWRRNRGFRQFNEPGPRASGGPRVRDQKILGIGGLHRFPDPVANPRTQSPTSALSTSCFQFSPLELAERIDGPQVTVEPGRLRALQRYW